MTASDEDSLIAKYFAPLARDPGSFGLRDDAAILATSGEDIVVTTDAIVEGVHFLSDDPPDTIARKALRVNLSDLAAKGACPAGFVLTLALRKIDDDWLAQFAAALGDDADHFGCPLLGGDTVSTPGPLTISITAFGRVAKGTMVPRGGARPGDHVVVTGTIGDAALGLDALQGRLTADAAASAYLIDRYRVPQPRNAIASLVHAHARAAMDISDGLAGDLAKLCRVSNVSADVRLADVPLSKAARALVVSGAATSDRLISGGDDYEILCAIPTDRLAAFVSEAAAAGVGATEVGVFVEGASPPRFIDPDGTTVVLKRLSFSHF